MSTSQDAQQDGGLGYPGGTNPKALEPFGLSAPAAQPEPAAKDVKIGFSETPSAFVPQRLA